MKSSTHASDLNKFAVPMVTLCLFFFNDPATTEIYTLSLHDALPIYVKAFGKSRFAAVSEIEARRAPCQDARSEEHTSELQSHLNLVCRLLLEKKKQRPFSRHCLTNCFTQVPGVLALCPSSRSGQLAH